MLGRWDKQLINQASDVPSIIFFIISYRLRALKTLYFLIFFIFEMTFTKNFARYYEKKNYTWNIRRLVNKSFVPSSHRIVLKIVGFLVTGRELNQMQLCGWLLAGRPSLGNRIKRKNGILLHSGLNPA